MLRPMFAVTAAAALCVAVSGVSIIAQERPAQAATQLPCDIYGAAGNTCEAAYSTTRALFATYAGNLYQIQRASDGSHLDIGVLSPGGIANAGAQQSFCAA